MTSPALPGEHLAPLRARRILRRERTGSSSPVVVDTDGGRFFVKLRGAAQGTSALVAEVVVAGLADELGLPVPARRIVSLAPDTPTDDRNDELADLLAASVGENLGFRHLEKARPLLAERAADVPEELAGRIRWLDWLTLNPDRTPSNPNILVDPSGYWLIDHGAALPFQHDWRRVTEQSPGRPEIGRPHLFAAAEASAARHDVLLTDTLTREVLDRVASAIPESFLRPLLPASATRPDCERRRAAYAAFLWKRLRGPRPDWLQPRDRAIMAKPPSPDPGGST